MEWLSKIDPNALLGLGGVIAALATWTWHKLRGDKEADFSDMIRGLAKQALHVLLTDPAITTAIAPEALSARAQVILADLARRAGVPTTNPIVATLIATTAQHVVGDVLDELRAAAGLEDQVTQLQAQVSGFPAQLAAIEAAAVAKGKAFAAEMVEAVPAAAAPAPTP